MKRAFTLLSALLLCLSASGGGKEFLHRIHPGLEWGYTLTYATYQHFNYLDPSIGFRIDEKGWTAPPSSNAFILGSICYDLSEYLSVSLISGYQGISKNCRSIPVLCRAHFYLSGMYTDGFFILYDFGVNLGRPNNYGNQIQLGTGYSFVLTPHSSIALNMGLRVVYDCPDIWDPIEEHYIPEHNIRRNDAWYCALNMGIALKF